MPRAMVSTNQRNVALAIVKAVACLPASAFFFDLDRHRLGEAAGSRIVCHRLFHPLRCQASWVLRIRDLEFLNGKPGLRHRHLTPQPWRARLPEFPWVRGDPPTREVRWLLSTYRRYSDGPHRWRVGKRPRR